MICLCRLPLLMAAACQLPQSCGLPFVLTLSSAAPSQGGLRRGHARMQLSDALVDQVKQELWRLSEAEKSAFTPSSSGLAAEQLGALEQSIAKLASELEQAESGEAAATQPIASPLSRPQLDALLAPQLPLLLTRGYQGSVRQMLTKIQSESERGALLLLNQYVIGVYEEMSDSLADLQWQQLNKLRELCDAAAEGGTDLLMETAEAMRSEFDTDFCNYLNFAIEQEELRLRDLGLRPVPAADAVTGLPLLAEAELPGAAAGGALAQASLEPEQPVPSGGVETQQWLLLLRLVKQGVYAMLSKDYEDDVKQIRYIMGLSSEAARRELTKRTLLELQEEERAHFAETVQRIKDNLSVQRDAKDLEIYNKVSEIHAWIEGENIYYSQDSIRPL